MIVRMVGEINIAKKKDIKRDDYMKTKQLVLKRDN